MTTPVDVLGAVEFEAPLVNPWPQGLFAAVTWDENAGPIRFAGEGVRIRPHNYGGELSTGVWGADWCGEPGSVASGETLFKDGVRPEQSVPFPPIVVWAYDECGPDPANRAEIPARASQNLRLMEQIRVERAFADQMLADTLAVGSAADVRGAIGYLENELAKTNTFGVVHAEPSVASEEFGLVLGSGATLRTPLGHRWVFGGGYVDVLEGMLIATSPVFGWRSQEVVTQAFDEVHNRYFAIAERTFVVGYEKLIAAVTIT